MLEVTHSRPGLCLKVVNCQSTEISTKESQTELCSLEIVRSDFQRHTEQGSCPISILAFAWEVHDLAA